MAHPRRSWLRVAVASVGAVALVVTAVLTLDPPGPGASGSEGLRAELNTAKALAGLPHEDVEGIAPHEHEETRNALSRAGETGADTTDPTTAEERRAAASYVAAERTRPGPRLVRVNPVRPRTPVPQDRYAMAGGCYRVGGEPLRFQAIRLGSYLLHDADGLLLGTAGRTEDPSVDTEWTARRVAPGRYRLVGAQGPLSLGGTDRFALRTTTGCATYPEAEVNVTGRPHGGPTSFQEVRGYVDAHNHGMAFEFLGGRAHCGRPWHPYGVEHALRDCPDHTATGGSGALLESVLSGGVSHDPVGWPTFQDWPAADSLTHEGTYWKWLERSWRGGQRIMVNLLVENNQLCQLYPLKQNSCDDMDSVRLQARDMYALQDYIDAQYGGPGRGFYRIVRNPRQAREVINAGKMAVVMGIETSIPFGCTVKLDRPQCDAAEIDRELDAVKRMGVRQVQLVNKFDNALSGVAGDLGATGVVVNLANFLETGSFWDMEHCEPADGESHDRNQVAFPDVAGEAQDALFGAVGSLFGNLGLPNVALPLYPRTDHCNSRGLTTLGEHTIDGVVERRMIFDPDHMSVKARIAALDQLERLRYSGVVSSHSWSTPDSYPRIYRLGGFIAPYAGDSTSFVAKWRRHLGWADDRFYFGLGYGSDINGFGKQGAPRGSDVADPVRYPVTGLNGVRIDRQRAGERVWDVNADGVAHYGLYPDWIADLGKVAGREDAASAGDLADDLARGAEAYLQMWERAEGVRPDACRNPGLRMRAGRVERLVRPGMGTAAVLRAVGQPLTRRGTSYGLCAKDARGRKIEMTVTFSRTGKVRELTRH